MGERRKFFKNLRKNQPGQLKGLIYGIQALLGGYSFTQFMSRLLGWYWHYVLFFGGILWTGHWLQARYQVNAARWPYLLILLLAVYRLMQWMGESGINLKNQHAPQGIISFEISGFSLNKAHAILNSWSNEQKKEAAEQIHKDFLFILGYTTLLVYILSWIGELSSIVDFEQAALFGQWIQIFMIAVILAAGLDYIENQVMLWMMVQKGEALKQPLPLIGALAATLKLWVVFSAIAMIQLSAATGFLKILVNQPGVVWWNLLGGVIVGTLTLSVLFFKRLQHYQIYIFEFLLFLIALAVTLVLVSVQ